MSVDRSSRLTALFREAGSAHHKAFIATDGDDPEWPIWYAEFLQPKLKGFLPTRWTKSEVVYLLLHAEKERSAITPQPSWPEFYALVFTQAAQLGLQPQPR